jgi:TP901 family phage tail tape measure protein
MAGVNRQLKGLQHEQKAATSSGTGFARGVDELRSKSDILSRTFELQQAKVRELKRRYDESKAATGENSAETQKAQIAYNKAVAEMNKTESQLKSVTAELERQTSPWRALETNLTNTGAKLQSVGRSMTSFGKNWSMKVTAPIVGMGALMLKTGMDFESSLSNVQAVSGATGDELALLEAKAREMGAQTSKSASEAADGLGYMALAGWDTQQMIEGLEPVLRLSEAANIDLGRASDLVTDSMSALQIEVKDLPQYLDNIAEASRSSNTSIDQLMQAYVTAGGNLAQFNVPLDESTALLGLLANRGLKGSEAGRALNAIMVNLTSGTGQAGKALEDLNISAFDADGQFIGLEETLRLVKDRTKDMTDEQRAQYISMIAGKEHLKSFQGLLAGLDDEYVDLKGSVSDANGALDEMATTMQDNARGNVARLKSAFEELSIQFSAHMLPAFTSLTEKAMDLVQWFSELDDGTKETIVQMGVLAAAVGPAAVVLGNLTTTIGGVVGAAGKLAGAIAAKGGLVAALGALANPVTLTIAGVAAVAGGIYLWNKRSKEAAEINLDVANSLLEQQASLQDITEVYEDLRRRSGLTTDQIGELLDIQHRMENESDPGKLADLEKAYQKIADESGLSREEIDHLLDANNRIIDQTPEVEQSFTERGNAVVESTEKIHEQIEALGELALIELQDERRVALEKEAELRETLKEKTEELTQNLEDRNKLIELEEMGLEEVQKLLDKNLEKQNDVNTTYEEREELWKEEGYYNTVLQGKVDETLGTLKEQRETIREKISDTEEELAEIEKIDDAIASVYLQQLGVNEVGKEGIIIAEERLKELRKERDAVKEKLDAEGDVSGEMQKHLDDLDSRIGKHESVLEKIGDETRLASDLLNKEERRERLIELQGLANGKVYERMQEIRTGQDKINDFIRIGTGEAEKMNEKLGKDIKKDVDVDDGGTAKEISDEASKSEEKKVTLRATALRGFQSVLGAAMSGIRGYATGTDHHPGGIFMAGEEGWELGRMGNHWELLGPGFYNRPAGYQVFTNDESNKILSSLNKMPAYATGARPSGEAQRVVNQMNRQERAGTIHQHITINSPAYTPPSENARQLKQASRQLAMEAGF